MIQEQWRRIAKLLCENPSLQPHLPDLLAEVYEDAAFSAIRGSGLVLETFPATSPYGIAQIVAPDWLPDGGKLARRHHMKS